MKRTLTLNVKRHFCTYNPSVPRPFIVYLCSIQNQNTHQSKINIFETYHKSEKKRNTNQYNFGRVVSLDTISLPAWASSECHHRQFYVCLAISKAPTYYIIFMNGYS